MSTSDDQSATSENDMDVPTPARAPPASAINFTVPDPYSLPIKSIDDLPRTSYRLVCDDYYFLDPEFAVSWKDIEAHNGIILSDTYDTKVKRSYGGNTLMFDDPNFYNAFVIVLPSGDRAWFIGERLISSGLQPSRFEQSNETAVIALWKRHRGI